jgi:hypothetical protein
VGIDLVLGTVVHAGMSMATAARLHAIAAHLLIPEESLAQHHRFQPGRLLPRQETGISGSSRRRVKADKVVLIGRLQLVSAGWIAARHSPGGKGRC